MFDALLMELIGRIKCFVAVWWAWSGIYCRVARPTRSQVAQKIADRSCMHRGRHMLQGKLQKHTCLRAWATGHAAVPCLTLSRRCRADHAPRTAQTILTVVVLRPEWAAVMQIVVCQSSALCVRPQFNWVGYGRQGWQHAGGIAFGQTCPIASPSHHHIAKLFTWRTAAPFV